MTRSALARMGALTLALSGCIQAASTDAPCPCVAPAVCCPILDRCVDDERDCPAAPAPMTAPRVMSIAPEILPAAGGTLTVTLDPIVDAPAVFVGGVACPIEGVDGASITCTVSPSQAGSAAQLTNEQTLRVDGFVAGAPVRALGVVRVAVSPFIDVSAAADIDPPFGQSITVARLFSDGRDLLFARGSLARPSDEGSQLMQVEPLRWADISAGGLVDGLASLVSLTPVHINADATPDLLLVWSRGHPQNGQIARALDGAAGFETPIPIDLPKLTPDEDVRVLPFTRGRETAVLGVRGLTEHLDRSLFIATNGVERLPPPFTFPARWTAPQTFDLALIDANGDGLADLLTCSDFPELFTQVIDPNGESRFVPAAEPLPSIFLYCRSLSVGDLDLDGHLDVVAVGGTNGERPINVFQGLRILLGSPDGFENVPRLSPRTACTAPIWIGAALPHGVGVASVLDVDLDGDLDIVVPAPSSACPGPPVFYRNLILETGRFDFEATRLPTAWVNPSASAIVADDLDQDGDLDLVYSGWAYGIRGRILRNSAIEAGAPGRALAVRVTDNGRPVYGATLAVDLDTPDDPDFAPGPERLRVAITGHTALAITDGPTVVPIGPHWGALALRVTWPDGHTRIVDVPADATAITVQRAAQ